MKPRRHEPQTADERAADIARVREALSYDDTQAMAAGVVQAGEACPRCGRLVEQVDAEALEYEYRDAKLIPTSVVVVALPCGDTFVRDR